MSAPATDRTYDRLGYGREELAAVMRRTYADIIDFVTTPAFKSVMAEMGRLPLAERPGFVVSVLLQEDALRARGVFVPEGLLLQRSAFGDRRPTLFVVKKYLPEKYANVWQNMNITFDNEFLDAAVSREPEKCWRLPLPVDVQAVAMAEGRALESL
ncbi:MAG: hypothetical protein WDM91_07730 [Rhizomicrobium sp.]